MQMHMWRLKILAAAVLVLVVSGCGKFNPPSDQPSSPPSNPAPNPHSNPASNPLIGKWQLADQSENDLSCISLVEVEFTEKTVTTKLGPTRNTVTVTYGRDGDSHLASAGNGQAYRVKVENGGIEANGCHLVPAIGKSNPLIGEWKPVGQDEFCRGVEKVEFAEETMTVIVSEQAQKEGQLPSQKSSFGVTYGRDGQFYVATGPGGQAGSRFKIESGGIEWAQPDGSLGCHLVPAN
jgi:hypothetical protein